VADILYVESDYVDAGYFVRTAVAQAALTAGVVIGTQDYFESGYVEITYTQRLVQADQVLIGQVDMPTQAQITCVGQLIRGAESTCTVTCDLITQAQRTRDSESQLLGLASSVIVTARVRGNTADLTSAADIQATPGRIRDAGLLPPTVTWDQVDRWDPWLRTFWDPSGQTGIQLPVYTAILVQSEVRQAGTATITGQAQMSITAESFADRSAGLSVVASQVATPDRTRNVTATAAAASTLTVSATTVIEGQATASTTSTCTVEARRIRTVTNDVTTTVAMDTLPTRVRSAQAALEAFNSHVTAAARTRGFGAAITVTVSLDAQAVKTADGVITASTQALVETQALSIAANRANLSSAFEQTAQPTRITPTGQATLSTQVTFSIAAGLLAAAQAQLQALDFVLVTARSVPLRAEHELRVPQETRIWPVLEELRTLAVTQETRLNMVLPEAREFSVPEETRVYSVI
jgi:hypothetical protein